MKLKKSLLALAVLGAFAGTAYADEGLFHMTNGNTTLDLYGILDAAEVTQNHGYSFNSAFPNNSYSYNKVYANAPSQTGAVNAGLSDSRLGLKGSTGLPGDMKAIFDLESGFDITTLQLNNAAQTLANNPGRNNTLNGPKYPVSVNADSSLNGQIFARAEWAGVEASWGRLTYGTQNNPAKDALIAYDPVKSDTFSPLGESGTVGGGLGSSEESRMHHSIKYTTKFGNGFDASVAYQFGNDWSTTYGDTVAARVGYEVGNLGLTAAYSRSKDAIVAGTGANLNQISISLYDIDGYLLAAKYKATNELHLSGGYEHFVRKNPGDAASVQQIGSIWNIAVSSTAAGFGALAANSGASQTYNIYFAGGDYDFTPQLNLAAGYYNTSVGANTSTTGTNTDYTVGTFSSVLDYKYTKALDFYAAVSANNFGGGVFSSVAANPAKALATNETVYGVGARFKF